MYFDCKPDSNSSCVYVRTYMYILYVYTYTHVRIYTRTWKKLSFLIQSIVGTGFPKAVHRNVTLSPSSMVKFVTPVKS